MRWVCYFGPFTTFKRFSSAAADAATAAERASAQPLQPYCGREGDSLNMPSSCTALEGPADPASSSGADPADVCRPARVACAPAPPASALGVSVATDWDRVLRLTPVASVSETRSIAWHGRCRSSAEPVVPCSCRHLALASAQANLSPPRVDRRVGYGFVVSADVADCEGRGAGENWSCFDPPLRSAANT